MKEPVDHILRPVLPWRHIDESPMTECGYDASRVTTIPREEYFARRKELGTQRCAMLTCMTCAQTAERHRPWEEDPREALAREIEWERPSWYGADKRGCRLRDELMAIAALIEAHADEFRSLISVTEERRTWIENKAVHDLLRDKKRT